MSRQKRGIALHGWVNLDKPIGLSSAQAVAAVKRLTNAQKAGHAGTLDPLATGILPIALGEATKTSAYMVDASKDYRFTLFFGVSTSTDDAEGEVTARSDHLPTAQEISVICKRFTGSITQTPPVYSAIKVNGQRAYALARSGQAVELTSREVTVYSLELIEYKENQAVLEVCCGKGTYIRSLARDMALALGSVGHMSALRRCRVGAFAESHAISLDLLEKLVHSPRTFSEEVPKEWLLPLSVVLDDIPAIQIDATEARTLRQGQAIMVRPPIAASQVAAMQDGGLVAICSRQGQRFLPSRVFNY